MSWLLYLLAFVILQMPSPKNVHDCTRQCYVQSDSVPVVRSL